MTILNPIEELAVAYDVGAAEAKVRRRRNGLWFRIASLVITVGIMVGFYFWQREQFTGWGWMVIYGVGLAISLGFVVGYLVAFLLARAEAREVGPDLALRIGRPGVVVGREYAPWSDVAALAITKGGLGKGPRLQLTRVGGGRVSVPFDYLDVRAATLDSTARAYSAGRHGVDLSALDN